MTGWKIDFAANGVTSCLQQSKYDDAEVIVSVDIYYAAKVWVEWARGKWLNLRNLVEDGTPLATNYGLSAWNGDVFHSASVEAR